jgi:hypothetical protein
MKCLGGSGLKRLFGEGLFRIRRLGGRFESKWHFDRVYYCIIILIDEKD